MHVPDFYFDTLDQLLKRSVLSTSDTVLVACGGDLDRETLLRAGFRNVVISNLDVRMENAEQRYSPYAWSFQDVEKLDYADASCDVVIAHSGLHHCRSPQRGLLEMYRVSRKAVLVFEPKDTVLTRLTAKLGLGQEYEHAAVAGNDFVFGGVANTGIPNFVFRWNRHDVEKAIRSFAPHVRPRIEYFNALRIPWGRLMALRNPGWKIAVRVLAPIITGLSKVLPVFANNVGFLVLKPLLPGDLQPWLRLTGSGTIEANREWLGQVYKLDKNG